MSKRSKKKHSGLVTKRHTILADLEQAWAESFSSEVPITVESSHQLLEETGIAQLLVEAEKYCYTRAILTCVLRNTGQAIMVDLERQEQKQTGENGNDSALPVIKYGYEAGTREWFLGKLLICGGGGVIMRSFLKETDPTTGFPVKELRAWNITIPEEPKLLWTDFAGKKVPSIQPLKIKIERLTSDDVYWASNTEYPDGKRLKPESGVRYC
ncbi:MAG: hypothetical protein WCS37_16725 [Chloroflexota bacterium]|nr:hypothetical protein [Chloroflexota bacterium]